MGKDIKRIILFFNMKEANKLCSLKKEYSPFPLPVGGFLLLIFVFFNAILTVHSQYIYQPNNLAQVPPTNNYLAGSSTFKQEIARIEINVVRQGNLPLPITQVPRLEQNDVLKVRLSEDAISGVKPDQSNWDWTFLVAYINPSRNSEKEKVVSQEIQFRRSGWYKEYSFTVPYDSQPIFFLYTKPKYRDKILNLISENQEEIRKIGEKTIELSDAYSKIGSFLNELQSVIYRNQYNNMYGGYGSYGGYGGYNTYNYGINGLTGTTSTTSTTSVFNRNLFMEQSVERLARSFNIQLPGCWGGSSAYGLNNGINNNYGNTGIYNSGYNNYGSYNSYGSYGVNNYGISNDFMNRAQCVAKSVKLEDFDISVSRMLQQGGILAAAQLSQKYPQLAFWINVAAAAVDIILKITKKTPLKLVPTVISSTENPTQNPAFQQVIGNNNMGLNPVGLAGSGTRPGSVKISLFAEAPPDESNFVTAYPLVVNKWQANPDPEVLNLPTPFLLDSCLHVGQNILQSTDLMNDWMSDNFTKDFRLLISSSNGFRKEFPLKKNLGLNGWELNLSKEDLVSFPKIDMALESVITGKRGFNEIKSSKFDLAIPNGGSWEVASESQKAFTVGGKRIITLKNQFGSCKCLQAVAYKPSFGGQFVFEAGSKANPLQFSEDGKEVSFEIDTTNFQPGRGQLELKQNGNESANLNLNLYPAAPEITDLKISTGDNKVVLTGYRLEQIQSVMLNNKKAILDTENSFGNKENGRRELASQGNGLTPPVSNTNPALTLSNSNQVTGINTAASNPSPAYPKINSGNVAGSQINSPGIQSINPETQTNPPAVQGTDPNTQGNYTAAQNSYPSAQSSYPPGYQENRVNSPIDNRNNNPSNYQGGNYNNQTNAAVVPDKIMPDVISEKVFVFEDPNARQDSKTISLELGLDDSRIYQYPKTFNSSLARPAIVVNEAKEVEATAIGSKTKTPFNLGNLPIFPIDASEVSVNVQNALTNYDFLVENIQIETRIENSQLNSSELPKASFEVLDWKNMTINFLLSEQSQRFLAGRRLQFRICDKLRGNSNWYTLKNKFARIPEITSIKCSNQLTENCVLKGKGIEYISQVSVDGGKTWYPEQPATLTVKPDLDGEKITTIPHFSNKKSLQIRLRDFFNTDGIIISDYKFLNTTKLKN